MGKYKWVVMTKPVPGREGDFDDWYLGHHIDDVLAVPGFASGQRFKLNTVIAGEPNTQYLAIYDLDVDDPSQAIEAMAAQTDTGKMDISDALHPDVYCAVYEADTPVLSGRGAAVAG